MNVENFVNENRHRVVIRKSIEVNVIQEEVFNQTTEVVAPLPGHLRIMKLTEFGKMIDLAELAFAEDEAREGRSLRSEMKGIQALVPVLRILFKIRPSLADHFYTLVWEVDGQFVALVTVSQQGGDKTRWYMANVATHPDYRGRGLAHRLVTAGLDHIRARGGQRALLDVRSDNVPAYQLYRKLGFAHLESQTTLRGSAVRRSSAVLPAGYNLRVLSDQEWQPRYELAARLASPEMQAVSPITTGQFQMSAFLRGIDRLLRRAQKRKQRYFVIEHGNQPVALASCVAHNGSNPHQVQLTIDPTQAAIVPALIAPAINYCLDQAAAPMLITVDSNLSGPIEELHKIGFQEIERMHTLGLKLAAGPAVMHSQLSTFGE